MFFRIPKWLVLVSVLGAFLTISGVVSCMNHKNEAMRSEAAHQANKAGYSEYLSDITRARSGDKTALFRLLDFSRKVDAAGALTHYATLRDIRSSGVLRQDDFDLVVRELNDESLREEVSRIMQLEQFP